MVKHFIAACCFLVLLAGIPIDVKGEDRSMLGSVNIQADDLSHDRASDTFHATGNVEISWDDVNLAADRASFQQNSGLALAEGRVRLTKQEDLLTADQLRINLATEQGEAGNGEIFVKRNNLHIRGEKIAKTGKDDYRIEGGYFTTCDGDVPSWRFTARKLDVTLEEFAVGRDAIFYIRNWPVLYTPYIAFPVKLERQSGFLFPRIGSSTKKGFYFDLPYYWAITPSQDLTVDLDIQSRRGAGLGTDYRYMRRQGSEGNLRGYGIYDTSQSRFRGDFEGKHREYLADGLSAKADVNLVTDHDFYRDFSVTTGVYNRQLLDSSVSVTKNWQSASLSGEVRFIQDIEASSNTRTLQRLPVLSYTLLGHRLGELPAVVSLDSAFVNFYREEGKKGPRLDLHPALTVYAPFPGGGFSAWAGYSQRFYLAADDSIGEDSYGSGLADAGAALTTSLERVYDVRWGGMQRIKHTIIPEMSYRYVENRNQENLPFFDFGDRIPGQSTVGWALSSFVTGKSTGEGGLAEYRELLWLRLSQGYNLSGQRRDILTLADQGRSLSDLRLEARLKPAKALSISTDSRYDLYRFNFSTAAIHGDVNDDSGNSAGIGYRMSRDVFDYLEGRVGLSLVKPLVFNYTARYSFDGGLLEGFYSAQYKQQCWSVTFSFRDRPDNREFLVSFTLAGIGGVGPVKAF